MRMSDWSSDVCSSDLVKVATEALDQLQPTAASHSRVMVLEVMGRDAGHITIAAGIAGGADAILIPELPYSIAGIATKIEQLKQTGRSEEHTSELQSLMRISYAVFCLTKKNNTQQ